MLYPLKKIPIIIKEFYFKIISKKKKFYIKNINQASLKFQTSKQK